MKTLTQHNRDRAKELHELNTFPKPNGIACDQCGNEMVDTDGVHLLCSPVRTKVHCPVCGQKNYRVV